jgi:hypothetical protein
LFVGPNLGGPLFFAHYSFMGFDPRNIKDDYANYFEQNRNHSLINRGWCIANPFHYDGYGPNCWGLTASDDPWGYLAHAPGSGTDNGTITPAAALPSMPYTPPESLDALKHFYRVYGQDLWGEYGFYDAFNPKENWFADSYLAIDQGPIINMIENFRSGLLWDNFMANPEIKPALDAIGFVENIVSTVDPVTTPNWKVFPTISNGELHIALPVTSNASSYKVMLTDVTGGIVPTEKDPFQVESNEIVLHVSGLFKGWGWIVMTDQIGTSDSRLVWIR